jgi:hypothetical protein
MLEGSSKDKNIAKTHVGNNFVTFGYTVVFPITRCVRKEDVVLVE